MTAGGPLGIIDAADYGARGGGNRDDSGGLALAMAVAANPGSNAPPDGTGLPGGVVMLTPGVLYSLRRTVQHPSNVEIVIPAGTIVRAHPSLVGPMFQAVNASGSRVTGGGMIDANRAGGAQADPLNFTGCSDCNVDGPIVQGGYTDGISLVNCTRVQVESTSQANGRHGLYHSGSTFCGGTVLARDNGQRVAGSGITFDAASTDSSYQLTATDTRAGGAKTQQYGMFEVPASGCDRNVLSASSLAGNAAGTMSLVGAASGYVAGAPTGAAGGGLAGAYPNPTIAAGAVANAQLAADVARANLFVNGGFEIAQRPGAPWTANGVFTLDYWRQDLITAGSTISTSQITSTIGSPGKSAQIVYTHVAASGYRYEQPVRAGDNLDQLRGKQITFGFQVKSTVAGTVRCVANGTILGIVNGAYNVGIAEETIQLTVAIPANETGLYLGVQFDVATATVELNDARLAIGAVLPTYAPLPTEDDLARAQRYYEQVIVNNGTPIFTGAGDGTQTNGIFIPWKVKKGGVPTITATAGQWILRRADTSAVSSTGPAFVAKVDGFHIYCTTQFGAAVVAMFYANTSDGIITAEWNPA